jgi:hypothetical protein
MSEEMVIGKDEYGNYGKIIVAKKGTIGYDVYKFCGHIPLETMPRNIVAISTNIPIKKFRISYGDDMKMRINGRKY